MELFAASVSVGFALLSLVAAFRWIGRATAGSADAGVRRAKLGFFMAFVEPGRGTRRYAARPAMISAGHSLRRAPRFR